jgi:hypothetical protein
MNATIFDKLYKQLMEDNTSMGTFGPNSELYTNLGEPNADVYATNNAKIYKVLGKGKKFSRRTAPETVFLTGKLKKNKKS